MQEAPSRMGRHSESDFAIRLVTSWATEVHEVDALLDCLEDYAE